MISPYMLQSIDVYKALTPDMEANAIGGAVNTAIAGGTLRASF